MTKTTQTPTARGSAAGEARITETTEMTKTTRIWGAKPSRSAPKGRQQMGETGFCKNLRFSAVSCENLRFPAVFCANLRLPNPLIYRASRKSAKICQNLRKCAFRVRFLPFAVSLLARPDLGSPKPRFRKTREKTPTPKISALARKRPVLPRANFVLTNLTKGNFVVT